MTAKVRDGRNTLLRKLAIAAASSLLLAALLPRAAAAGQVKLSAAGQVSVALDGVVLDLSDPVRVSDNRLYLPVVQLARAFGAQVSWDQDNEEATIVTQFGERIVIGSGVPVVCFADRRYVMDAAPLHADGRLYVPLRDMAEWMHAKVSWNDEKQLAELTSVPPGETDGRRERTVIPAVFAKAVEPYTDEDLALLARITQVEAGNESYESQLAVANVILNRVKDARFPSTIRDVIYAGKQFPPAHNGLLDKSVAQKTALRAAKDALNGKNNVQDAIYFYNPRVTGGKFWSSLTYVAAVGSHRFAK